MLKKRLLDDQLNALKKGDSKLLGLLRYILSQVQNKEIEKKEELKDTEVLVVLKKTQKELKEAIEGAEKGQRQDLVEQNQKQLELLKTYLPKEISDSELEKEVQ